VKEFRKDIYDCSRGGYHDQSGWRFRLVLFPQLKYWLRMILTDKSLTALTLTPVPVKQITA
jgi:hypothetical protein